MYFASDAGPTRGLAARALRANLLPDPEWAAPGEPPRDLKKVVLVVGLGALSWVATYVGMLELIEANMGDLPLVHKLIVGFSVAMLMTMIIWLLDQMFAPIGAFARLSYIAGYLFLSIISVGFGFGFYWKVLESRAESTRSAEAAVTGVQASLHGASTRLEQLNATLLQLAALSREKAEQERTKGTSCPNSKPGDGPRRKMRDDDAGRFAFASEFVGGRVSAVKAEMAALDGDLAKIAAADPTTIDAKSGTRNEFMKALGRKLDMTVTGFNALRTDPQLKQLRIDLSDRAEKTTFGDPKSGGFLCPDQQLATALRGAVRAIDQLPVLERPTIAAVEGSEATIEAFRRLTTTFYGLLAFKLPPSAEELRELQKKAIQSVEGGAGPATVSDGGGLTKRDYVPLAVAIFVDICLLLVSMGRPMNRLHGLVPKMREAERGPVIEILSRFNDIHRDRQIRENFELFRHVVFDLSGAYYVAVPLDAPVRTNPREREELRVEAQLLSNLFTSFEKDRIFRRSWYPPAGTIRKKLRRQGSKLAEAAAFRVYRFRDGAWPEIILGAVMGAARRAEAEKILRRMESEIPAMHLPFPAADPATTGATDARGQPPGRPRESTTSSRASDRACDQDTPDVDPRYVARFGAHAKGAQAELTRTRHEEDECDDTEPVDSATADTNARSVTSPHTVDVVLKRETATVTMPLSEARAPDGLIGRLGQALATIKDTEPAAENTDVDGDLALADAADIADRLRPIIPAK